MLTLCVQAVHMGAEQLTIHRSCSYFQRGTSNLSLSSDELPTGGQLLCTHHLDVAGPGLDSADQLDGRRAAAASLSLDLNRLLLLQRLLAHTYTTTNT